MTVQPSSLSSSSSLTHSDTSSPSHSPLPLFVRSYLSSLPNFFSSCFPSSVCLPHFLPLFLSSLHSIHPSSLFSFSPLSFLPSVLPLFLSPSLNSSLHTSVGFLLSSSLPDILQPLGGLPACLSGPVPTLSLSPCFCDPITSGQLSSGQLRPHLFPPGTNVCLRQTTD